MNLGADQLLTRLQQDVKEPLAPVYVISGDEPFQMGQLTDAIRRCAHQQGYCDRQVFFAERGFDWQSLAAEQDAISLFAERRMLDVRLPSGKPGDAGARVLKAYAERPAQDTLLMVTAGKLDRGQTRSKWYTALQNVGVAVQVWPVEAARLPRWLQSHMHRRGLQPSEDALRVLADRVEGNLLAADQVMEKLLLLYGRGPVGADQVLDSTADSARFDVFALGDTALAGDAPRALRMLFGLLGEGVEAPVVLWSLVRVIREAARLSAAQQAGKPLDGAMTRLGIWDKRKPAARAAIRRHGVRHWRQLLRQAAGVDHVIKGMSAGTVTDELVQLVLGIASSAPRLAGDGLS